MIILNYSDTGFSGDIEKITKELEEMSITKLRIGCDGNSVPKNNILALRKETASYLENLAKGKRVLIDLPYCGEESFVVNGSTYIKTIDLQVEIKEI